MSEFGDASSVTTASSHSERSVSSLQTKFYNKSVLEVVKELNSSAAKGLSDSEVKERTAKYGLNVIESKAKKTLLSIFLEQLSNPIVLLLIGASIIALFVGEFLEAILILSIVAFMACMGTFLEQKASKEIEALKKITSNFSNVLRNSKVERIDSREIVPGDIVFLHEGDKIPADCRVLETDDLAIDESILTGESVPIFKNSEIIGEKCEIAEQKNMLFAGTFVSEGGGKAIVVSTGLSTELGKIAEQIAETESAPTPLQKQLEKLSKTILYFTIGICAVILVVGVLRSQPFVDSLIQALALAIAFTPESLSAVITITLALGAKEMVAKQVIIKRLMAAEGLGSVSILATDKTGTITTGKMSIEKIWMPDIEINANKFRAENEAEKKVLDIIKYCNNKKGPTEITLVNFLEKMGVDFEIEERIKEHRFSSEFKRMTVIASVDGRTTAYSKGAPEFLIPLCKHYFDYESGREKLLDSKKRKEILNHVDEYAKQGYRVLCLATRHYHEKHQVGEREKDEAELDFIALLCIMDPLRPEVIETVRRFDIAGVRPIMITGDHPVIAKTLALQAGIIKDSNSRVITGNELTEFFEGKGNLTEEDILDTNIFARVTPEHKSRILELFNSKGYTTAMAGDGVNDAVAISRANVGIAVTGGSDLAREVADVIVTGSYNALANAIEVGRIIMQRTRLFLHYLLSGNMCEVGVFVLCIAFNMPMPLTALSLLVINLLTDSAPAIAMAFEKGGKTLMNESPRSSKEGIINNYMWFSMGLQGLFSSIYLFLVFSLTLDSGLAYAQTAVFTAYIFQKMLRAFTARSLKESVLEYGFFTNKMSYLSVILVGLIWFFIVYSIPQLLEMQSLDSQLVLILLCIALIFPALEEATKYINRKFDFFK